MFAKFADNLRIDGKIKIDQSSVFAANLLSNYVRRFC